MKIGMKYLGVRDTDNYVSLIKITDIAEVRLIDNIVPNFSESHLISDFKGTIEIHTKKGKKFYLYREPVDMEKVNKDFKKIKNLLRIVNDEW